MHSYGVEMISSPDRCPSALGGAQQDSNGALCLAEGGRHVSVIERGSWGRTETNTCVCQK